MELIDYQIAHELSQIPILNINLKLATNENALQALLERLVCRRLRVGERLAVSEAHVYFLASGSIALWRPKPLAQIQSEMQERLRLLLAEQEKQRFQTGNQGAVQRIRK